MVVIIFHTLPLTFKTNLFKNTQFFHLYYKRPRNQRCNISHGLMMLRVVLLIDNANWNLADMTKEGTIFTKKVL